MDDKKDYTISGTEYTERAYKTTEVATMLDIAVPTVRKYAQSLESKGYTFLKGQATGHHQARLFLEKDISALRYLKDIREKSNITVEQATNIVVERFNEKEIQPVSSSDIQHSGEGEKRYNELKELIMEQNELIKSLSGELSDHKRYIDERIEQRDRLLMQAMRESQEARKQIATAKEEEEAEQKNKGFFSRLFKR